MTPRDILMTCLDMCVLSGLDSLASCDLIPLDVDVLACADWVAKKLLLATGQALCLRRPPRCLWFVLLHVFVLCTGWLFPGQNRWRKTSSAVERLWASAAVCRSLLWLSGQHRNSNARKVGQLLEPRFRWVLWRRLRPPGWPKVLLRAAADELLHLQLQAVSHNTHSVDLYGCGSDTPFVLYAWASRCGYYVGIASLQRQTRKATPGPTSRWLEHMCGVLRTHTLESRKLRYRLMRRLRPEETFFLACRLGPETRIRAMENFEIASRRPTCNVVAFQGPVATKAVPSKRSRPPKQLRTCMLDVGPFDCADACVAVEKCASKLRKKQNPSPKQSDEKCSFSSAYWSWVKKLLVVHGVCGPCDVYDPELSGLLIRWCGCNGSQINWSLVEKKWNVGCGPAAVHSSLQFIKGRVARAVATRAINRELQARNLPKTFGFTCKVPRQSCLQVVRRALVQAVNSDPQWNSDEKGWLLSHVRFVSGAMRTHKSLCKAPAVSRKMCASEVVAQPDHVLSCCDTAKNLDRVEKIWDVPLRPSFKEDVLEVANVVRKSCACLRVDPSIAQTAADKAGNGLPRDPSYSHEQRTFTQTQHAYQAYTHDMKEEDDKVIVPDDKEKKFMWRLPVVCYQWLLLKFACISPAWDLTTLRPEDAESWCQTVFHVLVPDRLKKFLGVNNYSNILPYYYGTVKKKCFAAGQRIGHICQKPLHSCFRKIASCCKWPMRRRWRKIHRSWEVVIRQACPNDEIWSLKEACDTMASRIKTARVTEGRPVCDRCGKTKPVCVALTADAGQFFETVQPQQALAAARKCLSRCARMFGHTTVSIIGPGRTGFLGGSLLAKTPHVVVFAFHELFLAFAACLFVCYVSLGQSVFRLRGLPIGGVLSKIATSLVLGEEEFEWQCASNRRRRLGFSRTCGCWNREVARGRYVDDVLWISGVYCTNCLMHGVQCCYSVPFDLCEAGEHVTWLDLVFHAPRCIWTMKPKNWTLPPSWSVHKGFSHSFLCGRFARFDECKLSTEAWLDAAIAILIGFRSAGWSCCAIKGAIFRATAKRSRFTRTCLLMACKKLWA